MSEQDIRGPFRIYRRLEGLPLGRWLFTRLICLRAPYFSSISPLFRDLRPGRAVVSMRKRRKVKNHIGTVHALAMGNLCELAAGLVMEASLPRAVRWIPRGMEIAYLSKAESDLVATATLEPHSWQSTADVPVEVSVEDLDGREVVRATIKMYVTPAPPKS
jgi:acyl-coenzyme A thioesterase PaaI-like protein